MQHTQEREMDWNALMRAVLLMAFTAFIVRLFVTGDIILYIHPKFTWFTATAGVGLVLMALGQFAKALRGTTHMGAPLRGRLYIAFAAVVATGFLLRPHTFGADLAAKQGLNITSLAANTPAAPSSAPQTSEPAKTPPTAEASPRPTPARPAEPAASAAPPVSAPSATPAGAPLALQITSENFVRSIMVIYGNHPEWAGKRISVEGFVFSAPDLPAEEFGFARLVVTCHVAHAAPQGFVAYYPGGKRPADDSWHRIEGVLEPTMYQGESTLRLRVEKVTPIPKPADPYVYG